MDYEKAYKEALELMKGCIPDGNGFVNIRPCDIFPELKESEDERVREAIYNALKYLETELSWDFLDDVDILDAYAWLKKQGDKDKLIEELGEYKAKYIQEVLQKHLEEQKPAWSEADERNASYICAALDCYYRLREDRNNTNGQEDLDKARNWLYNKLKSLNPHNRWEPSDEQMDALDSTLQYSQVSHNSSEHLNSLFNDLKKLREK